MTRKAHTPNRGLAKLAIQCSADPEVSGWLIKHWFSASTFEVKIATFPSRKPLPATLRPTVLPNNKHTE